MSDFIVYNKDEKDVRFLSHGVHVYDVTYDKNGYPCFLIYEDGQWKRVSAKHYTPFNRLYSFQKF